MIISPIAKERSCLYLAEIRDMAACQQGQSCTRQNLYRAKAKYEKFERLFRIKIDL